MSQRIAAPASEPVTVDEVKANSQISHASDDAFIAGQVIPAAREHVENAGQLALISSTWLQTFDRLGTLRLDRPPLQSVVAVRYLATDGTQQVLDPATYRVVTACRPGLLTLAPSKRWPAIARAPQGVEVEFTAGYGADAADVPAVLKRAVIMLSSYWYENREAFIQGGIPPKRGDA